jgi:hypothetical protein
MNVSTRELALLVWAAVFVLGMATFQPVRAAFVDLVKSALDRKILTFVVLLAVYTFVEVYVLHLVGLWNEALLKTTSGWFVLTGVSSGATSLSTHDDPQYRKHIISGLRVAVLLEIIFGKFTFSLPVELLLVPFVTGLGLLTSVNDSHFKHLGLKRLLIGVQTSVGLILLTGAGIRAIQDFSVVADPLLLMEFLLPPILSLLFIPAMYLSAVYSRHERARIWKEIRHAN